MKAFVCSRCESAVDFESFTCRTCRADVAYLPDLDRMMALSDGSVTVDEVLWVSCANRGQGCNWLARDDRSLYCFSCRLTRTRPGPDDSVAMPQLTIAGSAKRHLLFQLGQLRLPIVPFFEHDGGLGFDLVSSEATGERVITGHANGIITVDLYETDRLHREKLRLGLGEAYRTMLGHFRHEVGHYYWQAIVWDTPWLDGFREMFGDERASYSEAMSHHYENGAPDDWRTRFISGYASMHPWEDFAETFAHYLHITDTIQTAAAFGLTVTEKVGATQRDLLNSVTSGTTLDELGYSIDVWMSLWVPLATALNQINRAMGKDDLYPFVLQPAVIEKLGFIHALVRATRAEGQHAISATHLLEDAQLTQQPYSSTTLRS